MHAANNLLFFPLFSSASWGSLKCLAHWGIEWKASIVRTAAETPCRRADNQVSPWYRLGWSKLGQVLLACRVLVYKRGVLLLHLLLHKRRRVGLRGGGDRTPRGQRVGVLGNGAVSGAVGGDGRGHVSFHYSLDGMALVGGAVDVCVF